jgi:hypothetical protein
MEFAKRLRGELSGLLDVIHQAGGGVVLEEFPGALEEDNRGAEPVDGESSAVRGVLIEEANRLAEMLERLRHGEDGITGARSEAVSPEAGPERRLARPKRPADIAIPYWTLVPPSAQTSSGASMVLGPIGRQWRE